MWSYSLGNTKAREISMETTEDSIHTSLSRKKAAQERQTENKRDRAYYLKNREKKIAQVKERRQVIRELSKRPARTRTDTRITERKEKVKKQRETAQADLQQKREKMRQQTRERVRKSRKKSTGKRRKTDNRNGIDF